MVEVAAAGGLSDGALDPGAVGVAVSPGVGGLLGAELALGFVLRAGSEGEMARVDRRAGAAGAVGVGSAVGGAEGGLHDGSPWRLVPWRQLWAVLPLGQVTCLLSQSMRNRLRSKPSSSRVCQSQSGGSGSTSSTPWSAADLQYAPRLARPLAPRPTPCEAGSPGSQAMDRLLSVVRDLEPGVGTAVVVGGVGAPAVGAGDEVDDGQAEAYAGAPAGGVAPAETVKRALDEFGWEA